MENTETNIKSDSQLLTTTGHQTSLLSQADSSIISHISNSIVNSISSTSDANSDNRLELSNQFSTAGFLFGLLLLVLINIGPYLYYKFVKNKKIFKSAGLEPKHTI